MVIIRTENQTLAYCYIQLTGTKRALDKWQTGRINQLDTKVLYKRWGLIFQRLSCRKGCCTRTPTVIVKVWNLNNCVMESSMNTNFYSKETTLSAEYLRKELGELKKAVLKTKQEIGNCWWLEYKLGGLLHFIVINSYYIFLSKILGYFI